MAARVITVVMSDTVPGASSTSLPSSRKAVLYENFLSVAEIDGCGPVTCEHSYIIIIT